MITYFKEMDGGTFFYPVEQNPDEQGGIDWGEFVTFATAVNTHAVDNYKTVEFAIYELYRQKFPQIVQSETVGNVVKSTHVRGFKSIVVLSTVTAAYIRAHRQFVEYTTYGDGYNNIAFNIAMTKMRKLTSAINGLTLTADERIFLISSYQNMLATY